MQLGESSGLEQSHFTTVNTEMFHVLEGHRDGNVGIRSH